MLEKRSSLPMLFFPIFIETLLLMLSGIVDTLMLSTVPNGAGAVGTANTYIYMFFMLLTVISGGMMAVMTQNIGAKKPGIAYQARQLAILCNGIIGILISIILIFFSEPILIALNTAPTLLGLASTYMRIVAIASFFDALIVIFSAYLRAFKHVRQPFVATIIGNVVNIALNSLSLFVFQWGVAGVAVSTVIGKLITLILVIYFNYHSIKSKDYKERIKRRTILKQIIKIGVPAAIEGISYSIAMSIVMGFINQMDPGGFNVTVKAYVSQITSFSFCAALALGQANSYFVGWRIGAKEYDECYHGTNKVALIGILIGIGVELLFALLGRVVLGAFNTDTLLINGIVWCLFIDIGLEIGRASNLVYNTALKTSGYALIPSIFSAVINMAVAVTGTYIFGILLGWGVYGAMFALALDECARAIFLYLVWRRRKWQNAKVVVNESQEMIKESV